MDPPSRVQVLGGAGPLQLLINACYMNRDGSPAPTFIRIIANSPLPQKAAGTHQNVMK